MRSVDDNAERFALGIKVFSSDSVVRWRDSDFSETIYVKNDGNATPARIDDVISLSKRKYGVDNAISDCLYDEKSGAITWILVVHIVIITIFPR